MPVTLERRSRWLAPLLALVGVAGVSIAALAWVRFPQRPLRDAAPQAARGAEPAPGLAPDGRIHVPLFVDPNQVRPTPRFRFTFDRPEALAPLRTREKLDAVIAGAAGDLERATRLMHWTRTQWEPGIPNPYPPLDAMVILADIRRGFTGGFCAQYNYVLAQALQSFGIAARYVSIVNHEVIEAMLPEQGGWICLDPLYDTLYRDESGRPLSVLQVHRRGRAGQAVRIDTPQRLPDLKAHLESFRSFAVWLKNDHNTAPLNLADLERYKVYFVDDGAPPALPAGGALWTAEPADLYPQ